MYTFNYALFEKLPYLLNTKRIDIAKACDCPPSSITYWTSHRTIPIDKLVRICNHYKLSVSPFFLSDKSQGDKLVSDCVDNLFVEPSSFRMIENHLDRIGPSVKTCFHIKNMEVSHRLGISVQSYYNYWESGRWVKITAEQFLSMMNYAHYYPGEWLVDLNHPIYQEKGLVVLDSYVNTNINENVNLRQENERLNRRMRLLELQLEELREEMSHRFSVAAEDSLPQ